MKLFLIAQTATVSCTHEASYEISLLNSKSGKNHTI